MEGGRRKEEIRGGVGIVTESIHVLGLQGMWDGVNVRCGKWQ